ncbi:MAG: hypothetical protein LBV12_05545 [Puniceicoccales bacterium]|jgi:Rad3-related DNA helicase|nr:hypothetical protein [Puniceicoccales bacterium]
MHFVPGQRRLQIAAGEFSGFGDIGVSSTFGGMWRAEVGRNWHETLRRQADDTASGWEFEIPISTAWIQGGWTMEVDGRIDQMRRSEGVIEVREIKTVQGPLPQPEEHWLATRRPYFAQLAIYCHALALRSENAGIAIQGTLVFVDPATGAIQEIVLPGTSEQWIEEPARRLAAFAESRWRSRLRLDHLRILEPFADSRAEWIAARLHLAEAPGPVVLLEAPTGFGKTALALDHALRRLKGGEVSRIVYVTGKNSGRIQVQRELTRLVELGALRLLTLHAKDEHAIPGISDDPEIWQANWRNHGLDADRIFDEGHAVLEDVRRIGTAAGVPPWEITRALLPLAEFILCDYNYVFSPRHAGVFLGLPGWDNDDVLLIVDEAHNLPARAADARTLETDWSTARTVLDALRLAGASREWLSHWGAWTDFISDLPQSKGLDAKDVYLLRDLSAEIGQLLAVQPPFWLELADEILEELFLPMRMAAALEDSDGEYLLWSPKDGRLVLECLCAAPAIGAVLEEMHRVILMSATLSPADSFIESCGLAGANTSWVFCDADWRKEAYDVAVDMRVDTRMKNRERHFRTTAETVLELGREPPVAVFFPSYRYAETIRTFIAALDPGFRVLIQPPGATPAENTAFIEEALFATHAIFLVMGGGLAEGIDLLGGRVTRAMIVSPGLPEVNPAQAAKIALMERRGDADAFRTVYLVPALRKVNQSLGRLVRGPGQQARILLHCRRFNDPVYDALLAPEYRNGTVLKNDRDLLDWITGP